MKLNWKHLRPLVALAVLLPCAGCGGFSATRSVSPLDFLLPGILKVEPDPNQAPADPTVPQPEPPRQVALAE